ncbi:MAG: photosystem II reaction center protein T [Gloeotrichia echinulata IR180]|jgi:photosystem II PsbT protein|nr:photosystem II reaction center protein T [Gloeotrichia echinulata DEX184]
MESVAYILILTLGIGVLFFAIAFREPPRIETKKDK